MLLLETDPQWYELDNWPLVGAVAVLVVGHVVSSYLVILGTRKNLQAQLAVKRIEFISEQLSKFYNPICTLLAINGNIFDKFGPNSYPDDFVLRDVAAEVWREMRQRIILPNNERIAEILQTQSHLLSQQDDFSNYLELNSHIASYTVFASVPSERHDLHRFPAKVIEHAAARRKELVTILNQHKVLDVVAKKKGGWCRK